MFTLGDTPDVNPVIKFLPHTLQHLAVDSSDSLHDPSSQLQRRFVEAVAAIDRQMLQRVWQELDYRIDICRITTGGHIEYL
jgi:hypothetical protein